MLGNLFERRAVTPNSLWGAGLDFDLQNNSGTFIDEENVYKLSGVSAAVSLIAGTISTLPMDAWVRRNGQKNLMRPKPDWVNRPDVSFVDRTPFISSIISSLMLDGNAFIRIFRDNEGLPVNLTVLNPTKIKVKRNGVGRVLFEYEEDQTLFDPDVNIQMGSRHLFDMILKFKDVRQALISYNLGETALRDRLRKDRPLPKAYLNKVMENYNMLKEKYAV